MRDQTTRKPTCPSCGCQIDLMRPTPDLVAAYPCGCWLTPEQARQIAEAHGNVLGAVAGAAPTSPTT